MKIYLVMFKDYGYTGVIIAVKSKEEAREVAKREFRKWHHKKFHYYVKEVMLI